MPCPRYTRAPSTSDLEARLDPRPIPPSTPTSLALAHTLPPSSSFSRSKLQHPHITGCMTRSLQLSNLPFSILLVFFIFVHGCDNNSSLTDFPAVSFPLSRVSRRYPVLVSSFKVYLDNSDFDINRHEHAHNLLISLTLTPINRLFKLLTDSPRPGRHLSYSTLRCMLFIDNHGLARSLKSNVRRMPIDIPRSTTHTCPTLPTFSISNLILQNGLGTDHRLCHRSEQ